MYTQLKEILTKDIASMKEAGLYKEFRQLLTPQSAAIKVKQGEVINFCANNYLGLANHPALIEAAHQALDEWGYGLSSVPFICGTTALHRDLEKKLATFLKMDDVILYSCCFDANTGLFETLLGPEDAIISDQLNHASIIDGVRLCKAARYRYKNSDMEDLEIKLKEASAKGARLKMIVTDGVFSMDGYLAKLKDICDLADKYEAIVMVDDSHATGFVGKQGRGTQEECNVMGRVDIITSTMGKALGGASGGFTAARQEIVDYLRQRSRPSLFSNAIPPVVAATTLKVLELLEANSDLREKLNENTSYFRSEMGKLGFNILEGSHPITPVMLGEAPLAQEMARDLLSEGIYVIGFFYPVVPQGAARIRVQISAAHTKEHLDKGVEAFYKIGKAHKVIS